MTAPTDTSVIDALAQYHPLIIEGMGGYDPRDAVPVGMQIVSHLRDRWRAQSPAKPVILVTQGDPIEERGISAITRHIAEELGIHRAMAFLDPDIADYHKPNADHHGVILEIPYSLLTKVLETEHLGVMRIQSLLRKTAVTEMKNRELKKTVKQLEKELAKYKPQEEE